MAKIQVIVGSARKQRLGEEVSDFVLKQAKQKLEHECELVDVKEWLLPYVTGDMPSATSDNYQTDGANEWASKIGEADGYIFVTPEYNASIPAPLKNNIDAIYDEWLEKSSLVITYSPSKGGAASAGNHLHDILERLKMTVVADDVNFPSWGTDYADLDDYKQKLTAGLEELAKLLS